MNRYQERIRQLQKKMKEAGVQYYLIPSSDFHHSEYVGDYFKVREFFSGFTGSNGTLLVTENRSYLWTDGRYFVQAERELRDTGIILMKMGEKGVPSISEFLREQAETGAVLGFDGRVISASFAKMIRLYCEKKKLQLLDTGDLAEGIWENRPAMPKEPAYELKLCYAGESVEEKHQRIRQYLEEQEADFLFLSRLDDIMWCFNIRGNDIECNPVALSYAFFTRERKVLFLQKEAVTASLESYFQAEKIECLPYETVFDFLKEQITEAKGIAEEAESSVRAAGLLSGKLVPEDRNLNPVPLWKAVKNNTETENIKRYFLYDSVCVCKFIYWLKHTDEKLDENKAAEYLDGLRAEQKDFVGLSFPTISAYGSNAAMMHYEAKEGCGAGLQKKGFLLVDSGGQYLGATTDVTRTIALGKLTEKEKYYFTLVAMGMLRLQNAVFLKGCTGRNLDICAREPLWQQGVDYKCGTGHGVGCCLNVHEGPQAIRWKYSENAKETVLEKGMLVTDEPGVYFTDEFGIRTENTLLVTEKEENGDGCFLQFEPLTMVPIDVEAVLPELMEKRDLENLNRYHETVYSRISPFLNEKEREWLRKATLPLIS